MGLRWIGGNVNSQVRTKVLANKATVIHWDLVRNKNREEISDTLLCQRDISHNVNFTY
jgi:hypothetical protein